MSKDIEIYGEFLRRAVDAFVQQPNPETNKTVLYCSVRIIAVGSDAREDNDTAVFNAATAILSSSLTTLETSNDALVQDFAGELAEDIEGIMGSKHVLGM